VGIYLLHAIVMLLISLIQYVYLMLLKTPQRLGGRPRVLGPHNFYHDDYTIRLSSLISTHTLLGQSSVARILTESLS
jgi:hypothetical protein